MPTTSYDFEVEQMRATNQDLAGEPVLNNEQFMAVDGVIKLIANTNVRDNRAVRSVYRRARHMLVEIYQTFGMVILFFCTLVMSLRNLAHVRSVKKFFTALQSWYSESGFHVQVCDLAIKSFARILDQLSVEPFVAIYLASPKKGPLKLIQALGPHPRRPSLSMDDSDDESDQWELPTETRDTMPEPLQDSQPTAHPAASGEVSYPQLPIFEADPLQQTRGSASDVHSPKVAITQAGSAQDLPSEVPYPKLPLDKIESPEPVEAEATSSQATYPQLRVPKVELPRATRSRVIYPPQHVTRFRCFTTFPQLSYPPLPIPNTESPTTWGATSSTRNATSSTRGAASSTHYSQQPGPEVQSPQPVHPQLSVPKVEPPYMTHDQVSSSAAGYRQRPSPQVNPTQTIPPQPANQPRPIY